MRYTLEHNGDDAAADELTIRHAGNDLTLHVGQTRNVALQPREALLPVPTQPPGCAPQRRHE